MSNIQYLVIDFFFFIGVVLQLVQPPVNACESTQCPQKWSKPMCVCACVCGSGKHVSIVFPLLCLLLLYWSKLGNSAWKTEECGSEGHGGQTEERKVRRVIPSHDPVFAIWHVAQINSVCLMRNTQPSCLIVCYSFLLGACQALRHTSKCLHIHKHPRYSVHIQSI